MSESWSIAETTTSPKTVFTKVNRLFRSELNGSVSVEVKTLFTTTDNDSCCDDPICVQGSIQAILANLSDGIEVNDQKVSINPLHYPDQLDYNVNIFGFQFELITTNNVFNGLADAVVSNNRVNNDGPNTVIHFETFIPTLEHTVDNNGNIIIGKFELKGFGAIKLNETGSAVYTYYNTEIKHKITLERVSQNGQEVLRVESYRVKFHTHEVAASFGNLFGGRNPFQANAFSDLINKFGLGIVEYAASDIDRAYSKVFGRVARLLLNGYPTEKFCAGKE